MNIHYQIEYLMYMLAIEYLMYHVSVNVWRFSLPMQNDEVRIVTPNSLWWKDWVQSNNHKYSSLPSGSIFLKACSYFSLGFLAFFMAGIFRSPEWEPASGSYSGYWVIVDGTSIPTKKSPHIPDVSLYV